MKDYFLIEKMKHAFAYHKVITDSKGRPVDYEYLYVNNAFEKLTGLKREHVVGKKVTELIIGIQKSQFDWIQYYGAIGLHGGEDEIIQYFDLWDKWYKISVYSPKKGCFVTVFDDVTDIKKIEEKAKKQREILSQITEGIEEVVFIQNVEDRRLLYINSVFKKVTDLKYEDFQKNPRIWTMLVHPYDQKMVDCELTMEQILKQFETKKVVTKEFRILTKEGVKWIKIKVMPVYNEFGKVYRIIGIGHDVTKEKQLQIKIKKALNKAKNLAMYDDLTKLYNRRAFWKEANKRVKKLKREKKSIAIIMTDIDRFKGINDAYGHDVGDKVLKHFSKQIKKNTRAYDIVARLGGEEFIILLENVDIQDAFKRAEQIRKQIEKSKVFIKDLKQSIKYTASFGVSEMREQDYYAIEKVIKRADKALYKSKEMGRNKVTEFR